jgi:TonB family protein
MRFLSFTEGLILSICLHLLLVGTVLLHNMKFPPPSTENSVAVDFIEVPKAQPRAQVRKIKQPDQIQKQIVEQAEKPINNEKPDDTRFLSAYNQRVEKQTVSHNKGDFKNISKPQAKKALKVAGERSSEKTKGAEKTKPTLQDLSPEFNPLAIKERQQKKQVKTAQGTDIDNSDGGDVSQTSDYIKDVDEGVETMLNSREFKYYTYYARIRRQLSQHWEPKVREKLSRLFRQGRQIASDRDHVTKLLIVLNEEGSLVKVQIMGESGVHDLDDAAMEAFRSAAPFPNPPKGIIDPDGTVKIRWDFVLES